MESLGNLRLDKRRGSTAAGMQTLWWIRQICRPLSSYLINLGCCRGEGPNLSPCLYALLKLSFTWSFKLLSAQLWGEPWNQRQNDIFKRDKHHARAPMRQRKTVNTVSYENIDQVSPHQYLSGEKKKKKHCKKMRVFRTEEVVLLHILFRAPTDIRNRRTNIQQRRGSTFL